MALFNDLTSIGRNIYCALVNALSVLNHLQKTDGTQQPVTFTSSDLKSLGKEEPTLYSVMQRMQRMRGDTGIQLEEILAAPSCFCRVLARCKDPAQRHLGGSVLHNDMTMKLSCHFWKERNVGNKRFNRTI